MKKLLSIAAIAALMSSGVQAADGTTDVELTVLPSAVVGFSAVNTQTLGEDTFVTHSAGITLGSRELGAETATETSVYVRSNAVGSIRMTVADTTNEGDLRIYTTSGGLDTFTTNGDDTLDAANKVAMAYTYTETGQTTQNIAVDGTTPVNLMTGTNTGDTLVGIFSAKPTLPANGLKLAGNYKTTLTFSVVAN